MDPWTSILTKAGEYGPWGLVIAAMGLALVWATLRNAKLQDLRADDGKMNVTALVETKNAIEKFTTAMAARTDAITEWSRQMSAFAESMKELRSSQERFLERLANRDERNR